MRNIFASELTALAREDERIVLLSGDIGNKLFDKFKVDASERFFNCGVAEANIISMAAGMAAAGLRPVAYTITPFITYRCIEQIRVDVCYHNQPVVIVGVGSGLGYASLGATHHSCEDIAMLRSLPGMTVLCPADPLEVKGALHAALKYNGPVYIRLGKKGEPNIHKSEPKFEIGKYIELAVGSDVCLLCCGTILPLGMKISEQLRSKGHSTTVFSCHTVKPLDAQTLENVFKKHRLVVSIEEHSLIAGFGSAVSEWLVDNQQDSKKLLRFGTADKFFHEAGEQEYAQHKMGLSSEHMIEKILKRLQG